MSQKCWKKTPSVLMGTSILSYNRGSDEISINPVYGESSKIDKFFIMKVIKNKLSFSKKFKDIGIAKKELYKQISKDGKC